LGHLLRARARAGEDWILSYGPLGALHTYTFDPNLFAAHVAWGVAVALGAAAALAAAYRGVEGRRRRLAFAAVTLTLPLPHDQVLLLALLAASLVVLRQPRPRLLAAFGCLGACAVLAHVKVNLFLAGAVCGLGLLVHLTRARGPRWGAAALAWGGALHAGVWLALGQRPGAWPAYLGRWFELAHAYGEAGAFQGEGFQLVCGVVASLALTTGAALTVRRGAPGSLEALVVVAGLMAFAYKHGFVRQEGAHTAGFFGFAAAAALLGWAPRGLGQRRRRALAGCLGLALVAALLGQHHLLRRGPFHAGLWALPGWAASRSLANARDLATPGRLRERLAAERARNAAAADLPRVRAAVRASAGTVDVFPSALGLLFLNGLEDRWRWRPVFQSNLAATPGLAAWNAEHMRGPGAPDFVLLGGPTLGGLPLQADGPALVEVLRRYEPVLVEGGALLLRRTQEGALPAPVERLRTTLPLGEPLAIPGGPEPRLLRLTLRPSLGGRARRALLRAPRVKLELALDDGRTVVHDVLPGMLAAGVWIDPHLDGPAAVARYLRGEQVPRVTSLRVLVKDRRRWCFAGPAEVVVSALPDD
jgi:hypothetical protein